MDALSPKATGKPPEYVTLDGALCPWDEEEPTLLSMPGSDLLYLACFHELSALEAVMAHYKIKYTSVKQIEDEQEFLSSVTDPRVAIILNARVTDAGRLRFLQIHPSPLG